MQIKLTPKQTPKFTCVFQWHSFNFWKRAGLSGSLRHIKAAYVFSSTLQVLE